MKNQNPPLISKKNLHQYKYKKKVQRESSMKTVLYEKQVEKAKAAICGSTLEFVTHTL